MHSFTFIFTIKDNNIFIINIFQMPTKLNFFLVNIFFSFWFVVILSNDFQFMFTVSIFHLHKDENINTYQIK